MRVEILKANSNDYEELIDFINYVFSHSSSSVDFPTLLPKLYKKDNDTMNNHYLVKENGKIKSVVGSFPMEYEVLGERFSVAGIGSVSVHPYSRGCGYMKKLMNMAIDDMKNENVDISFLGGLRQRYEHFLYEPCGQQFDFYITSLNVNYKFGKDLKDNIKFKELKSDDLQLIDKFYEMYLNKEIKVLRDKDKYFDTLNTWNYNSYAVFKDNLPIGYLCSNNNGKIDEIVLMDNKDIVTVIASYIYEFKLDEIKLSLPIYETEKIGKIMGICENYSVNTNKNFRIFNYEKVIKVLLTLKGNIMNICDGEFKIHIQDHGTLYISVSKSMVNIEKVNDKGDINLTQLEAMELLFSPAKPFFNFNKNIPSFVNTWLPLPLFIDNQDSV
ncbi:MAG: GNAT family N-acetyltransferase [Peptostreptococcaceae bacterium]